MISDDDDSIDYNEMNEEQLMMIIAQGEFSAEKQEEARESAVRQSIEE